MEEASSTRRVELVMKLPQLQDLIKRDPAAYRDEFEQQVGMDQIDRCLGHFRGDHSPRTHSAANYRSHPLLSQHRHFLSQLQLFRLNPSTNDSKFGGLINFLSHVTPCYRDTVSTMPTAIASHRSHSPFSPPEHC